MRWPWQKRTRGRHAAMPAQRWAEPAFPPADGVASAATNPPLSASTDIPVQSDAPAPVAMAQRASSVRLGFADGSEVALQPTHPSAMALREVANLLAGTDRT